MQIVFNGEAVLISSPRNLLELLEEKTQESNVAMEHVVVAVNQDFIHRHNYPTIIINDGDNIEMLSAVVGG